MTSSSSSFLSSCLSIVTQALLSIPSAGQVHEALTLTP